MNGGRITCANDEFFESDVASFSGNVYSNEPNVFCVFEYVEFSVFGET